LVSVALTQEDVPSSACKAAFYDRGTGVPKASCNEGFEKKNGTCYSICQKGYEAAGDVCKQQCPSNFTEAGDSCKKPASYPNGNGYIGWDADLCFFMHGAGCVQIGNYYCPLCPRGYLTEGLCKCTAICIEGQKDNGSSCAKLFSARKVEKTLICESGLEEHDSLCYPPCKKGFYAEGSLCVETCTPGSEKCGGLCIQDKKTECSGEFATLAKSLLSNEKKIETEGSLRPVPMLFSSLYPSCTA